MRHEKYYVIEAGQRYFVILHNDGPDNEYDSGDNITGFRVFPDGNITQTALSKYFWDNSPIVFAIVPLYTTFETAKRLEKTQERRKLPQSVTE